LGCKQKKNNQTPSPLGQATIFVWEKMLGEKNIPNLSHLQNMVLGSTVAIIVCKTVCSEENTVLLGENMFCFFDVWENSIIFAK